MIISPVNNTVFVPKAPEVNPKDPIYYKFVSTIDK
jgi:hypothetical protein